MTNGDAINMVQDPPSFYNDASFHRNLSWIIILLSPVVFLVLIVVQPASYGKLQNHKRKMNVFGPMLPSKWCWMIFESPNVIMIIVSYYFSEQATINGNKAVMGVPNKVLLSLYGLHYINRSFVYPLKMSSDSKFPLGLMAFAALYCLVNG